MQITIPYRPMPHQKLLHQTTSKELVAVTGRQIGKTVAAVNEIIKRAIKYPETRNWYVTVDYKQAKRNVWDLFQKYCVKEIGAKFNSSELSILLPNRSRIELIGVENAESLRGAAVHFMVLDEYADFPRRVWPAVLRPMFSTTNGDVWFIGSPKGLGNDLYDKYVSENTASKFRFPSCEIVDGNVYNVLSEYAKIDEIQRAYNGDTTPEKLYFKQEYLAEFTRPTGTVYAEWPIDNYCPTPYDAQLPLHLTMDYGVNDPTSLIWIQPTGSEFKVIDYYEGKDAGIGTYASIIRGKPYKPVELYTGDDAGRARTQTTGTSVIEELSTQYGITVKTTSGLKIPDQVRITHKHMKSLFVDSKLSRFRDCILNYRYPEKRETQINQSNELPIHDQYSHAMRALEYYFVNYQGVNSDPFAEYKSKSQMPINNDPIWM